MKWRAISSCKRVWILERDRQVLGWVIVYKEFTLAYRYLVDRRGVTNLLQDGMLVGCFPSKAAAMEAVEVRLTA